MKLSGVERRVFKVLKYHIDKGMDVDEACEETEKVLPVYERLRFNSIMRKKYGTYMKFEALEEILAEL